MQPPYIIDNVIKRYRKTDDNFRTLITLIIEFVISIAVISVVVFVS